MSTLSIRMSDASKRKRALWDGFPKQKREKSPASALFPSRTASPLHLDHQKLDITPLPSPILPSRKDSSPLPTPPPVSAASKTSAFFSSPWSSPVPVPVPPPPPVSVQRSASQSQVHSSSLSGPRDFASSPQTHSPLRSSSILPIDIIVPSPRAVSDSRVPSRSQTQDFFNGPKYIPTPPPSVHSVSSSPDNLASLKPHSRNTSSSDSSPKQYTADVSAARSTGLHLRVPKMRSTSPLRSSTNSSISVTSSHDPFQVAVPSLNQAKNDKAAGGSDLSRSSDERMNLNEHSLNQLALETVGGYQHLQVPTGPTQKDFDERPDWKTSLELQDLKLECFPHPLRATPTDCFANSTPHATTTAATAEQPPHPRRPSSRNAVRRETHRASVIETPVEQGSIIGGEGDASGDIPLELISLLGQGAFSSVWLAKDIQGKLTLRRTASTRKRRRKSVNAAKRHEEQMHGLRPSVKRNHLSADHHFEEHSRGRSLNVLDESDGKGACLPQTSANDFVIPVSLRIIDERCTAGKVVAVKMMDRALCDANDRTRISFVREVEVLRHISHPSIVSYLHSFTTATHHCLVLEHVAGGELFELMNVDENHAQLTEHLLRRMFGELCRAVGWMHGVALIHRDIKLENILLTVNPFNQAGGIDIDALPQPLVKLTDFGLARFIDPKHPLLTTRCGSETYAAPEIITGQKYDGRQTDAWACGVVLYALATRMLPFDRKPTFGSDGGHSVASGFSGGGQESRRSYLMRIAHGAYSWPDEGTSGSRLATDGVRRVAGRLLLRDPKKRAKVWQLWDDEWMKGYGAPAPPRRILEENDHQVPAVSEEESFDTTKYTGEVGTAEDNEDVDYEEVFVEDGTADGMLVDGHDIASVASQELV